MKYKHLLILFFAFALSSLSVKATDYTIEPTTAVKSTTLPVFINSTSLIGSLTQQILLASELGGATEGDITDISFYYGLRSGKTATASFSRTIQIWLMQVPSTGGSGVQVDSFAISKPNTQWVSEFLYIKEGTKAGKAGDKVFEGSLTTAAITSSDYTEKKVTLHLNSSFHWDGSSNIVMTVIDVTSPATTIPSDTKDNLQFYICKTDHPRFAHMTWLSGSDDTRAAFINNLTGRNCIPYGTNTLVKQVSGRAYVPKTTFTISTSIPAPTNLAASSITTSSATLSWNAAAGADSYEVRYGTTSGSLGAATNVGNVTSHALSGLEEETTYYFQVRTKIGSEFSAWTDEASFNTVAVAHEHNGISFSKWASNNSFPTSGNFYLNSDIAFGWENIDVTLTGNLNLCLNGHVADLFFRRIIIPRDVTFTLFDNVGGGKITSSFAGSTGEMISEGLITVNNGGTLILGEGAIENTYDTDEDGVSIAICSQGTLKLSGAPSISSNDIDIYLGNNSNITIESDKPLTNSTPFKVSRLLSGKFTSGWENMSGADPSDHFVSAKAGHGIGLSEGEAAFLAVLALDENSGSNESTLSPEVGQTHNVAITRSTLTSSQFNTFCLPFALSNAQLEDIFGAGYDLEEFVSSEIVGEELVLSFNKVTSLEAGKPYLLQPANNVTNPVFAGVTIGVSAPLHEESDTYISFHGVFNPTALAGGNKNLLFLGAGNELFWPAATGNIKGFRAYFEVKGAAQKARAARIAKREGSATGVGEVQSDKVQGTKILRNGQLYIMYNGTMYDVMGRMME